MELVGASEAAEILGVEVQRISRYVKTGAMPRPVAVLASTPVWNADDVAAMADGRRKTSRQVRLAGTSEAARMLGVKKSQVGRWLRTGRFPAPYVRLAAGPVWKEAQIRAFAKTRV